MKYRVTFDGVDRQLRDLSNVPDLQQYTIARSRGMYIRIGENLLLFYEIKGASFPLAYRRYIISDGKDLRIFTGMELPEILMVLKGSLHYFAEGMDWTFIQATQFTMRHLPGKYLFSHLQKGEYAILSIGIGPRFLGRLVKIHSELRELQRKVRKHEPYGFRINGIANPYMLESIQAVLDCRLEGATRQYFLDTMVSGFLLQALPILVKMNSRSKSPEPSLPKDKLLRVAELIKNSPEKKYNTGDLGQLGLMSISSLMKGFKQHYGMTIHQFVIHQRMEKARMLIINTPMSIKGIAKTVGYRDTATFTHTFRRLYGFPPSALRQR